MLSTFYDHKTASKGRKKALIERVRQDLVEDKNISYVKDTETKLTDFDLKRGINTGAARLFLLYNQITAVGTNVNFANRLQELAKIDQILISSSTERKIRKQKLVFRKININPNDPIKSFEDIDCCYEII